MPEIRDEYVRTRAALEMSGQWAVFITNFHTHPGGSDYPSSFDGPTLSYMEMGTPAFGIIVTGVGKYSYYDSQGKIDADDRRLNNCIQYKNR
jgi:proteasome lid subunit RPN8/RPN11